MEKKSFMLRDYLENLEKFFVSFKEKKKNNEMLGKMSDIV